VADPVPNVEGALALGTGSDGIARVLRKNLTVVSLAYVIGGLAGFAAQTYLARRLGNVVFGEYVAALSLASIVSVLDELGGTGYVVREGARDPTRLAGLISDSLPLKLGLGAAVVGVTLAAAVALRFGSMGVAVATLLALMLAANAISRTLRAGLQAVERMEQASALSIANAVVSAVLIILIVRAGGGLTPAMAASAAVSVALIPASWWVLRRRVPVVLRMSPGAAGRIARASLPFTAFMVLTFAVQYADALIVRGTLGESQVGLYGAAYRLLLVLQWVPSIYVDSAYRTLSHLSGGPKAAFALFIDRSAAVLFLLGLPIAAGGAILGDRVIVLVFGHAYLGGGSAFRILLLSLPLVFANWILLASIVVGDRPRAAALLMIAALAGNVSANVALVPRFGIDAAAWVNVATDAVLCVAATWTLHRAGVRVRWPILVWPALPACAALAFVTLVLRHLPVAVPIVAGAATYVVALLLLRVPGRLGFAVARRRALGEASPGNVR